MPHHDESLNRNRRAAGADAIHHEPITPTSEKATLHDFLRAKEYGVAVEPLVRLAEGVYARPSAVQAMSGGIDTCHMLIGGQWANIDAPGPADEDASQYRDGSARRLAALLGIPVVEPGEGSCSACSPERTAENAEGPAAEFHAQGTPPPAVLDAVREAYPKARAEHESGKAILKGATRGVEPGPRDGDGAALAPKEPPKGDERRPVTFWTVALASGVQVMGQAHDDDLAIVVVDDDGSRRRYVPDPNETQPATAPQPPPEGWEDREPGDLRLVRVALSSDPRRFVEVTTRMQLVITVDGSSVPGHWAPAGVCLWAITEAARRQGGG